MGKRQDRQGAIREVIRAGAVRTQRDLAELLQAQGFDCTQATVSRDIMEMGLEKSPQGCYVAPEEMRLQRMVAEFVEGICASGNLVVVKTGPAAASGLSAALDATDLPGALGTVAGDDTIFIATEGAESSALIRSELERFRRR